MSWNGREFDYWHTNRVVLVLSAAHSFYVTPTTQRACALAFMSPFSTVSVFYVTPAVMTVQLNQTEQISLLYADICHCWFVKVKYIECSPCHTGMVHCENCCIRLVKGTPCFMGCICQSLSGRLRPHHFCLHLPSATMCY